MKHVLLRVPMLWSDVSLPGINLHENIKLLLFASLATTVVYNRNTLVQMCLFVFLFVSLLLVFSYCPSLSLSLSLSLSCAHLCLKNVSPLLVVMFVQTLHHFGFIRLGGKLLLFHDVTVVSRQSNSLYLMARLNSACFKSLNTLVP